jgi:hypothetical protein
MRKWRAVLAVVCVFVAGVGVLSVSAQTTNVPTEPNVVILQTPPATVVQAQPSAVVVQATPWCAGAYSPVLGTNFGPCPAVQPPIVVTTVPPTIVDID